MFQIAIEVFYGGYKLNWVLQCEDREN